MSEHVERLLFAAIIAGMEDRYLGTYDKYSIAVDVIREIKDPEMWAVRENAIYEDHLSERKEKENGQVDES